MPEKDPTTWSLATWILAIGMSFAGGAINWYAKVRAGHARAFNFVELVGEMFTAGVVGLGAFMAAQGMGQSEGVSAAVAGIAGHMATRLLFAVERYAEKRIKALLE